MNLELEAAGEMLSTGLIAHEIDGAQGEGRGTHAAPKECANCKATVSGNFCGACGQKAHLHHSVLHLGEELAHGILHFDTKGWRTLPMLAIRPGQLTRRYVDGQRTRFVSPLALFLFMMFLMFFVFSLTMGDSKSLSSGTGHSIESKIEDKRLELEEAKKELAAAKPGTEEAEDAQRAVTRAQRKYDAISVLKHNVVRTEIGKVPVTVTEDVDLERMGNKASWFKNSIKHAVENPELTKYKLKNAAYKYAFLLVPLSMPFLWIMLFWKKTASMYTHAVFSLYSLSFMSFLMVILALLSSVSFDGTAVLLFCVIPPVHMYFQLRDTYLLKRWEALWRTAAMLFFATIALTLYTLMVLAISA